MQDNKNIVTKKTRKASTGVDVPPPKALPARPTVSPVLRKKKRKGPSIAGIIIAVLIAVVAALALLYVYNQKQKEDRQEILVLQEKKQEAEVLYARMATEMIRVETLLGDANSQFHSVKEMVLSVTGSEFSVKPEERRGAPSAATTAPIKRPASVSGVPDGVLSREELEWQRSGGRSAKVSAASADEAKRAEELATHHKALLDIAREISKNVDSMVLERSQIMEMLPLADQKYSDVMRAQRLVIGAAAAAVLERQMQDVKAAVDKFAGSLTQIENLAKEAGRIQAEDIRQRTVKADAERRQQEAEELQARTEEEVKRAESQYALAMDAARRFAFAEVVTSMERMLPEFTTDAGRDALTFTLDRIRRLQGLKTLLIGCLNRKPYRWGWGLTAADSQDILGADEAGVKITRGTVPWSDVSLSQIIKMIAYLGKTERTRSNEKAEDYISAALLCDVLGKKDEARKLLDNALQINNLLRDEALRLMPDYE